MQIQKMIIYDKQKEKYAKLHLYLFDATNELHYTVILYNVKYETVQKYSYLITFLRFVLGRLRNYCKLFKMIIQDNALY